MRAPASSKRLALPEPITTYLMSHAPLLDSAAVANRLQRDLPVVHLLKDDAIDQALLAAPSAEDPDERDAFLGAALGSIPGLNPSAVLPPEHLSYIAELQFHDLNIETTDATDKADHLLYRDTKPPPDALWLPSELEDAPGQQLRIIAIESLEGRFELTSSTRIFARSRPPRWP
jgi:hypothetical protein